MNLAAAVLVLLALQAAGLVLIGLLLRKVAAAAGSGRWTALREEVGRDIERTDRALREELSRGRSEAARSSQEGREEMNRSLAELSQKMLTQAGELSRLQREQLESVRTAVDERLRELRSDNAARLEEMRRTVDEKLEGTLEKRLGESFKLVSDRLEQVHRGLGEMQTLAGGVGDLKRVLANVKVRGTWGEIQLGALLEQVLTPEQYATNVATREGSQERVEFAIRLPGQGSDEVCWLPVDAKFPQEDYLRLVEASERGDAEGVEAASRGLDVRLKASARDIHDKYLCPPRTTDFGILFLPTEGLYAEVVRRPGLVDQLQRDYRVAVAGPTTLGAFLNSLQMGFRTLAIQKRSGEVWQILASIKTEFGRYGDVLGKVQKKLQEASNTIDQAATRTRAIERRLKAVQEIPSQTEADLFPLGAGEIPAVESEEP